MTLSTHLRHLRRLLARLVPAVVVVVGGFVVGHPLSAGAAVTSSCSLHAAASTPEGGPAYYLFESNGAVAACGGAPLHGSDVGTKLVAPVVSGAATASGGGYWLVTANGGVDGFGNARIFGSPVHLRLPSPITAFAPTPDGEGYWLVSAKGNLFHYGDAHFFGSTVHDQRDGNVVAIVPTTDGRGYWIITAKGIIDHFGDAASLSSLASSRVAVVAAAATPTDKGLWLLTKDGGVHNIGTAGFFGSAVHRKMARPPTGFAPSTDGAGYLFTTASGNVFDFGDAAFEGSLASTPPRRPTGVMSIAAVVLPAPPAATPPPTTTSPSPTPTPIPPTPTAPTTALPHGQFGYDVSNYQCAPSGSSSASAALPPSSPFSVLEVAGWLDSSDNPCLASEASWATTAAGSTGTHSSLNLFLNAPDQSTGAVALDASGPAGTCATLAPSTQAACLAYNYGYEGAGAAFTYAASQRVSTSLWWVDVENANLSTTNWSNYSAGQYWSSSTSLNADTIQGALDALRAEGVTVGIYSSSVQFPLIAGSFVPSGAQVPLWVAGVPWTIPPYSESGLDAPSVLSGWCAGTSGYTTTNPTDLFARGVPWVLQETPGNEPSPYGIDPDYAC